MLRNAGITFLLGNVFIVLQIVALYLILDEASFVEYRSIINTANFVAGVFTMGLVDSAHLAINKKNIQESQYLGTSCLLIFFVYSFSLTMLYTFSSSDTANYIGLGMVLGFIISIYLVLITMQRIRGDIDGYFKEINLNQRVVRTFIIVSSLVVTNSVQSWFILLLFGYLVHLFTVKIKGGIKISFSFIALKPVIKHSFLFFIVSLLVISISRIPYYFSLYFYNTSQIVTIDMVMTAMLLLLVPFLSQYKISEIKSNFNVKGYIRNTETHYSERLKQQRFLVFIVVILSIASEFIVPNFLDNGLMVTGILMIGMTIIISGHHYLAILQLTSNKKLLIKSFFAILATLLLLIAILNNFQFDYNVETSFVALSIVYALIGKIVWCSIAQNVSNKFIDIRLLMEGVISALFLIGLSFV
ncbi:hypothetical protein [Bathymodiolus thermophilus thioautotrophic gill symbiont]|uniref:Polysaccharide biosynthesis protein n=1 Tax=Bathymodiolus thermophilus thioautotrophic gill symbiont TaxID=2360 RepID=A0A1J5TS40_9GAMM|nr:hypothetical protein [Bathymodiolus thermophilus thioautotrophic gill symbiont]OIR23719.1 hypothetical protein BGC33_07905 [Bathymodiolus thermophilus thioautotrophic gill symbiont]